MYLRWRRALPQWIRIVPVELPGRGGRFAEPFVRDFDALVEQVCHEQASELQGHFALLGHSMGALLAYGMTRHLLDTGRCIPRALLVSGSPAPWRRDPDRFKGKDNDEALLADLRKQGGTPEEVFQSAELIRITLDVLAADYRVCDSFVHERPCSLPMPLHAFGGRDDDIEPECLQAWRDEAGPSFTLDWFDGGHFFIRQHEQVFLSRLVQRLAGMAHEGASLAGAHA